MLLPGSCCDCSGLKHFCLQNDAQAAAQDRRDVELKAREASLEEKLQSIKNKEGEGCSCSTS